MRLCRRYILTDGGIAFDGEGRPFRTVHVRDVTALTLWHLSGGRTALVSGLGSKALEAIAATWRCAECRMWVKNKLRVCEEIAANYGLTMKELAFIGDDIIDVRAMQAVGVAWRWPMRRWRPAAAPCDAGAGGKGGARTDRGILRPRAARRCSNVSDLGGHAPMSQIADVSVGAPKDAHGNGETRLTPIGRHAARASPQRVFSGASEQNAKGVFEANR